MSANYNRSTPKQQEKVVEMIKRGQKLLDMTPTLLSLLEEERFECEFDLHYLRHNGLQRLFGWFRGIPFWSPNEGYYKWAKANKPELISQFRNKGERE